MEAHGMIGRIGICALTALAGAAQAQDVAGPFDCVMDPRLVVQIGAPVTGVLEEVSVDQGDFVTKGQEIARLDSTVEQSTIALLELRAASDVAINAQAAQLELIRAQQQRVQTLVERNVAANEQLDQVNAEVVTAEALLEQARLEKQTAALELDRAMAQMDQRRIESPIDGVIQQRSLYGGEFVNTNSSIVTIAQLDPLRIVTFLPVSLYPSLAIGGAAEVTPAAPFDTSHPATITGIDQIFDAASGTFAVYLELPNPDMTLPAGHRCLVRFTGDAG